MERKNAWKSCDEAKLAQVNALCADYIKFISDCKTERECVEESIRLAEAAGYKNLNDCIQQPQPDEYFPLRTHALSCSRR